MTEMVERVARAIAKRHGDEFDAIAEDKPDWTANRGNFGGRFRDVNEPYKSDYLDMAEAAIEAMREPTEAMIDEADGRYRDDDRDALVSEWQIMIAAALK